jgi:primosomal protein N' (replication factor Y)
MIVKVAFPISIPGLYDYRVPESLCNAVVPGIPVRVPLRNRLVWGVVVETAEYSQIPRLKDVAEIKTSHWADTGRSLLKLYSWIADYYHCGIGKVFRPLVRKGIVDIDAKKRTVFELSGKSVTDLSAVQIEAAGKLKGFEGRKTIEEIKALSGLTGYMILKLAAKDVLVRHEEIISRIPEELNQPGQIESITLSEEQSMAVETIYASFGRPGKPFMLYGITGSGKTHVYIELARRCLALGKSVIILVPEISLTPQTIRRFRDSLGDVIAVIHSRMSGGERRDSLEDMVSGRKKVAIGVRSVILAPMENVGLIVVDEEHDQSYKQDDMEPRYNARDVAVMRGKFQNAAVVLGSATPVFESYYNAVTGKYELIRLLARFGEARLPTVRIVDMNEEHNRGNWSILSTYLKNRIEQTLSEKRQVILLLNRRGFSVSLICRNCGHTYSCPNCSVHLVYHRHGTVLICHQCGHTEAAPSVCPVCKGEQIKYSGTGIQKAEEYLKEVFPEARILRMDQDSTRKKGQHVEILSSFEQNDADILIGTQMVAKGLNFPGVRLVGVLHADTGLHLPDFRASEKTFQLLTQVAGRAGRKDSLGEVVVQTYMPGEPGVVAAEKHDYEGFYKKEIESRRELGYPPYGRLARIIVEGKVESAVKEQAVLLGFSISRAGAGKISVLGPSPAAISRLKGVFRYAMLIKSSSSRLIHDILVRVRKKAESLPRQKVRIIIDVDPVDML